MQKQFGFVSCHDEDLFLHAAHVVDKGKAKGMRSVSEQTGGTKGKDKGKGKDIHDKGKANGKGYQYDDTHDNIWRTGVRRLLLRS